MEVEESSVRHFLRKSPVLIHADIVAAASPAVHFLMTSQLGCWLSSKICTMTGSKRRRGDGRHRRASAPAVAAAAPPGVAPRRCARAVAAARTTWSLCGRPATARAPRPPAAARTAAAAWRRTTHRLQKSESGAHGARRRPAIFCGMQLTISWYVSVHRVMQGDTIGACACLLETYSIALLFDLEPTPSYIHVCAVLGRSSTQSKQLRAVRGSC